MGQKKQVIIHCGFHKTGTSSIQHTLGENRKELEKLGYIYPDFVFKNERFYNQSIPLFGYFTQNPEKFDHYTLHHDFVPSEVNGKIKDWLEYKLANCNKVIFSDEFISSLSLEGLSKLKGVFEQKGFDIKVIAFVRDPVRLATSQVQQRIAKKSIQKTLRTLSEGSGSLEKIEKLTSVFGANVEFYCFEKACHFTSGPVGYFLNILGVSDHSNMVFRKVNESRSSQAVRLVDYIQQNISLSPSVRKNLIQLLQIKGDKFALTSQEFKKTEEILVDEKKKISALLGKDFFIPTSSSLVDDDLVWNETQINTVVSLLPKLENEVALLTYQYFNQLDEGVVSYKQLSEIGYSVLNILPNAVGKIKLPVPKSAPKTKKFKKVMLHVGPDKTGSTTIQYALHAFRGLLLENGVFYPTGLKKPKYHRELMICVSPESELTINSGVFRGGELEGVQQRKKEFLAYFENGLCNTQAELLVLSCEDFPHLSLEGMKNLKGFLEKYCDAVEVVFYARDPVSYALSALSQRIKLGDGIDQYFPAYPFQEVLEKLIDVFGKNQITIRDFSKNKLVNGDVLMDFLSLLDLPKIIQEQLGRYHLKKNQSLSHEAIQIGSRMISLLDGYIPSGEQFLRGERMLGVKFLPRIRGKKLQLTNEQFKKVNNDTKGHTDYLKKEFDITFKQNLSILKAKAEPTNETLDFAARVLVNVLVPDFDISTGKKKALEGVVEKRPDIDLSGFRAQKTSKFKKVILHVGTDKAGSTAIQNTLYSNAKLLLENNVFYPVTVLEASHRHHTLGSCFIDSEKEWDLYNPNLASASNQKKQEARKIDVAYLEAMSDLLAGTQADIVVLSCEGFSNLHGDALKRMKDFLEQYCDEVEVLLYVRPPLSYAASALSQRVKQGRSILSENSILSIGFKDKLEKFIRVFDKNHLNVRVFSRNSLPKGDVILDVLSLLNLPEAIQKQVSDTRNDGNPSLSEEAIMIGSKMAQILDGYIPEMGEFRREIGARYLTRIEGRKYQLNECQREAVLKLSKPHIEYLFEEFGIVLRDEAQKKYVPSSLSAESIDFTASVLIDVLVPGFQGAKEVRNKEGRVNVMLSLKVHLWQLALKFKPYINERPWLKSKAKYWLDRLEGRGK